MAKAPRRHGAVPGGRSLFPWLLAVLGGVGPAAAAEGGSGEWLPPPPVALAAGEEIAGEAIAIHPSGRLTYTASVRRAVGFLGLEIRPVDRETAARLGLPPFQGVVVISVERLGPAARAGIVRDDVVIIVGDDPVRSADGFVGMIEGAPPGSHVGLGILRDGVRGDVTAVAGSQYRMAERSAVLDLPLLDERARTGLVLAEATPEAAAALARAAGASRGLLVADLLPGGPAFRAGILPGDLLVGVAGRPAASGAEWRSALDGLRPGDPAKVALLRRKEPLERTLAVEEDAAVIRECRGPLSVVSWKRSAPESTTTILWGLLWRSGTTASLDGPAGDEPVVERRWGVLFDLVRWRSTERTGELRLFWILPLRSAKE